MKHLLLLVALVVTFASCKKESEPEPIASERVAGTYAVSRYAFNGPDATKNFDVTLPRSASTITQTGTLEVKKFNNRDDAVTVVVTIKTTNQQDIVDDFQEFDLKQNGSAYDLMFNNLKYGTIDGTNINIDFVEANTRVIVIARRQ